LRAAPTPAPSPAGRSHNPASPPPAPKPQGELDLDSAKNLVAHGAKYVVEGANMPSTGAAGA
jgi:hypothetical protein